MKKINQRLLLLSVITLSSLGAVGCGEKEPTPEELDQQAKQACLDAATFIYQMYKDDIVTPANYQYNNTFTFQNLGTFTVEWSLTLGTEVENGLVTSSPNSDNTKTDFKIDVAKMVQLEEPASYVVNAKVCGERGQYAERKFDKKVPSPVETTVANFQAAKASTTDYYKMSGVVSTVNKIGEKSAFTLTDSTGTVFTYSGANVTLGSQVTLVGIKSEYNGFTQLDQVTILDSGTENKLNTVIDNDKLTTLTMENVDSIITGYKTSTTKSKTLAEYSPKFYKITGGYLVKNKDEYLALNKNAGTDGVTEDKTVSIYYHSRDEFSALVGTQVDLYGAIRGFANTYITIQTLYCVPAGQAVTF